MQDDTVTTKQGELNHVLAVSLRPDLPAVATYPARYRLVGLGRLQRAWAVGSHQACLVTALGSPALTYAWCPLAFLGMLGKIAETFKIDGTSR